jgi:hypothetical protein
MKGAIPWDVMPCSSIEIYQVLKDVPTLLGLLFDTGNGAVPYSEILVNLYRTTKDHIPADSTCPSHHCENLGSKTSVIVREAGT